MTLLMAVALTDRIVVMTDGLTVAGSYRLAEQPKIQIFGKWLVAAAGSVADGYAYLYGLTGEEQLDDPWFQAERMQKVAELRKLRAEEGSIDLQLLIVRQGQSLYVKSEGVYDETGFAVAGAGWALATQFRDEYRPPDDSKAVLRWGWQVLRRVGSVEKSVEVPPMYWADTVELMVHRLDEEPCK